MSIISENHNIVTNNCVVLFPFVSLAWFTRVPRLSVCFIAFFCVSSQYYHNVQIIIPWNGRASISNFNSIRITSVQRVDYPEIDLGFYLFHSYWFLPRLYLMTHCREAKFHWTVNGCSIAYIRISTPHIRHAIPVWIT